MGVGIKREKENWKSAKKKMSHDPQAVSVFVENHIVGNMITS